MSIDPFHHRFDIELPIQEAQKRFINRTANEVEKLVAKIFYGGDVHSSKKLEPILEPFMHLMGHRYRDSGFNSYYSVDSFMRIWGEMVSNDYHRCLEALERLNEAIKSRTPNYVKYLSEAIKRTFELSEIDLGISWENDRFIRKGAGLLDKAVVNEPLRWLADPKYENVRAPFEKGLKHFLEGDKEPDRLADAVTDMYEAMEALAKIITGRDKDLSGNKEKFISTVGLSSVYNKMLDEYIDFGCDFRHAVSKDQQRKGPSLRETEGFVYLTGLFIRLAIQPSNP